MRNSGQVFRRAQPPITREIEHVGRLGEQQTVQAGFFHQSAAFLQTFLKRPKVHSKTFKKGLTGLPRRTCQAWRRYVSDGSIRLMLASFPRLHTSFLPRSYANKTRPLLANTSALLRAASKLAAAQVGTPILQFGVIDLDLGRVRPALAPTSFVNETDYRPRPASLRPKCSPSIAATRRREMLCERFTPGYCHSLTRNSDHYC